MLSKVPRAPGNRTAKLASPFQRPIGMRTPASAVAKPTPAAASATAQSQSLRDRIVHHLALRDASLADLCRHVAAPEADVRQHLHMVRRTSTTILGPHPS